MQNFLAQNPNWTEAQVNAAASQASLSVLQWLRLKWILRFFEEKFNLSEAELFAECQEKGFCHTTGLFLNFVSGKFNSTTWYSSPIHSLIAGGLSIGTTDLMNFLQFPPNWHSGCSQLQGNPQTFSVYMNENCEFVSLGFNPCTGAATALPNGKTLCGFAGVSFSPIALILDDTSSISSDMRIVEFSLDPHRSHRYSLWKGSGAAPLLVYDPKGTGVVSSAAQLFGDWTFGGKGADKKDRWTNGYEALGTLDRDGSGAVDGAELAELALWFDENRNGKSEAGEVRPITQEGVTSLYYRGALPAGPGSKDLRIETGFQRVVNGKQITGATVDWYGETFESRQEAAMALAAALNPASQQQSSTQQTDAQVPVASSAAPLLPAEHPLAFSPTLSKGSSSNISGYWVWTIDGRLGDEHPGFLAIEQQVDGTLSGYSVVEAVLAKNDIKLRSIVKLLRLSGKVHTKPRDDGRLVATFTVSGNPTEGEASSEILLSKDGTTLLGKTTQTVQGTGGQSAKFDYTFRATRIRFEPSKTP